MRVIELRDERHGLEAFVVVDHDQFPIAAGGTRMLPDVDIDEVARLARAMTWKFAAWRVPYSGAKAGVRFAGGGEHAPAVRVEVSAFARGEGHRGAVEQHVAERAVGQPDTAERRDGRAGEAGRAVGGPYLL